MVFIHTLNLLIRRRRHRCRSLLLNFRDRSFHPIPLSAQAIFDSLDANIQAIFDDFRQFSSISWFHASANNNNNNNLVLAISSMADNIGCSPGQAIDQERLMLINRSTFPTVIYTFSGIEMCLCNQLMHKKAFEQTRLLAEIYVKTRWTPMDGKESQSKLKKKSFSALDRRNTLR